MTIYIYSYTYRSKYLSPYIYILAKVQPETNMTCAGNHLFYGHVLFWFWFVFEFCLYRVKCTSNYIQKCPKSIAKIFEKNLHNPGPETPKPRSGGFWAALGCFLVTRDLPDASGTPSRRLWGGSWGWFWLILAHLGSVLGAQDGPKVLPRRPKMPLRCLQDSPRSDLHQKK